MQWSQFYDDILERLSHDGDPAMARVSNLSVIHRTVEPRPDLDVAEGKSIAAAHGADIAYGGVTWIERSKFHRSCGCDGTR